MAEMKALRAHSRGGPGVLVYESAPRPEPGVGEVLIEVHAAAITFDELLWDETWARLPTIPSHEVSGVIAGLGAGVERFGIGDEVYGLIRFDRQGAAAEYVTVPADDLAARPQRVSHVLAAAVPLAALTAWQALVDHAGVVGGERVLVHGGAGGVGAFAVQLAAARAAHVTATCAADDRDRVRSLGAERALDFRAEAFDEQPGVFDVVIDTVGGETLNRSFPVVRRGGRLVTLQAPPPAQLAERYGISASFFVVSPDRAELSALADMVDAGDLAVAIAATFPLSDGRTAFESRNALERPPGKTVLVVRQ